MIPILDITESAAASMRAARRIAPYIRRTPLVGSTRVAPADLSFKCENFQLGNSFKARGAFAKLTAMAEAGDSSPAITASSGNHGVAAALAARRLGRALGVVLPRGVNPAKLARIRELGVEIMLHGEESGAAESFARAESERRGLAYVSPYNDSDIIAGQGTIGVELIEDRASIDTVFVAMGGGGLIGGVGAVLKAFRPGVRVVGCAARNTMALATAMRAGRVIDVPHLETLADGVSGGMDEGAITLPLARAVVDEVVVCDEAEITAALRRLILEERQFVEGAAALALAGFLRLREARDVGASVVILCGANFDAARVMRAISEGGE